MSGFVIVLDVMVVFKGSSKTCDALRKSGLRWSYYVHDGLFSYAKQHVRAFCGITVLGIMSEFLVEYLPFDRLLSSVRFDD